MEFPIKSILVIACSTLLFSCGENIIEPDPANAYFNVDYHIDDEPLVYDQMNYKNEAGNTYSVKTLDYYLSNITLHHSGGTVYSLAGPFYYDAFGVESQVIEFKNIPPGTYEKITMYLGLSEEQNISNSLPNTTENFNMAWPDQMGGGYHFMKLEGNFTSDTSSTTSPYALHLGTNSALVSVVINESFTLESGEQDFTLKMNLNEWFRSPYTYNLAVDGSHTMPDSLLRRRISSNGEDVFTLETDLEK